MNRVFTFFIFCVLLFVLTPTSILAKTSVDKQITLLNEELNLFVSNKNYTQALSFCNAQLRKQKDAGIKRFLQIQKLRLFVKSKSNLDSVPIVFQQQFSLRSNEDSLDVFLDARSAEIYGHYFFQKRKPKKCLQLLERADSLYGYLNADAFRVYNLNMLGTIYHYYQDDANALFNLLLADELLHAQTATDSALEIDLHIDIGMAYFKLERYEKALSYYLTIAKYNLTPLQQAQILNNIGIINIETKKYDLALVHIREAERLYTELESKSDLGHIYNNLASVLKEMDSPFDTVMHYFNKSLFLKEQLFDTSGIVSTKINIAHFYLENGSYSLAESMIQGIIKDSSFFSLQDFATANYILSNTAKAKGDYKNALAHYRLFNHYSDSILNLENVWKLARSETGVELINKQNKIDLLNKQRELDVLHSSKQQITLVAISLVSIVAIIILAIVAAYYYSKQKLETKLRNRDVKLSSISNLVKGQEDERLRMAKDLHDGVGNNLAITRAAILKTLPNEEGKKLAFMITQVSEEVRNITHDLMPVAIRKLGLKDAILDLAEKWQDSVQLLIDVNYTGNELTKDKDVSLTVYRILQELIKNSHTHGAANYILININQLDNELRMSYEDNGTGMKDEDVLNAKGVGFKNIKSRVSYLNGSIDIFSDSNGVKINFVFRKPKHENAYS